MNIYNPYTENLITTIKEDTDQTLVKKLQLVRHGSALWKETGLSERIDKIKLFGHLVSEDIENLASILTSETGKPIQQARSEIKGAHNRIEHLSKEVSKWLDTENVYQDDTISESIGYEPLGVIANISAWNYPYNVGYNVFLYALATGNGVLYKPSEYSTLTGLAISEKLYKAGIPEEVFQVVVGGGSVGKKLIKMDFDGYFFTGSYRTGQQIAIELAHKLVPLQLELGGKDPLYVMDDVKDVKQAAINAAEGSFYNAGQSCCAVERIYVSERIYEDFIKFFVEEISNYNIGNPMEESTFIGPLTRPDQLNLIERQLIDAKEKGAKILTGGNRIQGNGSFFEPTVLVNVNHGMKVMTHETFGPLVGIQKVTSDVEAVSLMLDTPYGLTAAVFGTDKQRVFKVLNQMNTGTVYWNCCDRVSPRVPWSGRKNSGIGSTLSYQGIRAFVNPKAYHIRK